MAGQGSGYGDVSISGGFTVMGGIHNQNVLHPSDFARDSKHRIWQRLYFDTVDSRRAAIHPAEARTCEWIWKTNFAQWIRSEQPESNLFWICGKPGSGKSTLMRHLSSSRKLKLELPEADWAVVNFFFDFRQGDRLGNSLEGLLRSLLMQIIQCKNDLPSSLIDRASDLHSLDNSTLEELFGLVFRSHGQPLFLLIDGLDEYNGNLRRLMEFFVRYSRNTQVRICLASRPHSMIDVMLGTNRFQMSEQNLEGITAYVQLAIKPFVEPLTASEWDRISSQIIQRADGVFLWVYLVLEEILNAFSTGESFGNLIERLNDIPEALDSLYQRILDAIPNSQELEIALVLEIVSRAEIPLELGQLHGMVLLLNEICGLNLAMGMITEQDHFLRRIQSVAGGLFHFRKKEPQISENNFYQKISKELIEYGTGITYVSVMHKTVSSLVARIQWIDTRLSKNIIEMLSQHCCKRLGAMAVLHAEVEFCDHINTILSRVSGKFCSMNDFRNIIKETTGKDSSSALAPLIHFGILAVIPLGLPILNDNQASDEDLVTLLQHLLKSRLATLHFAFSYTHFWFDGVPCNDYLDSPVSDLILAAHHELNTYLESHIERIRGLQDYQRDRILAQIMCAVDVYQFGCRMDSGGLLKDIAEFKARRRLIHTILQQQQSITVFHIALHLFIQNFNSPTLTDDRSYLLKTNPDAEVAAPEYSTTLKGALSGKHLLFIWVCGNYYYEDLIGRMNAREQLTSLLSLGVSIRYRNGHGVNACKHLIDQHLFKHVLTRSGVKYCCGYGGFVNLQTFELAEATLERLYLLEEYGADFDSAGSPQTLLETFHTGRRRFLRSLPHLSPEEFGVDEILDILKNVMTILDEIGFMLQHKDTHGHLPRPMLREYDLDHYYCKPRKQCSVCEATCESADLDNESESSDCSVCIDEDW